MNQILEFDDQNATILIQAAEADSSLVKATSKIDDAISKIQASFADKIAVISDISNAVQQVMKKAADGIESVEVEFGVSFTAKGSIYVAQAETEATIKVKLVIKKPI